MKIPAIGFKVKTGLAAAILACTVISAEVNALAPAKNEKARLKACERQICDIIVGKKPAGPDLSCNLEKTWAKNDLKKGGKSGRVNWLFGDAQCKLDFSLQRATIIGAVTNKKFKLRVAPQFVDCRVERSNELKPVNITLAPKIEFEGGEAKKVWLNVKKINGPKDIKGLIWTVAKLEDSVGIFHQPMIRQINKFLAVQCPKVVNGKDKAKGK